MTPLEEAAVRLADRLGPSVVDDIREIRQQLDEEAGHDVHRLAEIARAAADEFRALRSSEDGQTSTTSE